MHRTTTMRIHTQVMHSHMVFDFSFSCVSKIGAVIRFKSTGPLQKLFTYAILQMYSHGPDGERTSF